jgi:hypothetical protein
MRRVLHTVATAAALSVLVTIGVVVPASAPAAAASCPPASVGGPAIAKITAGKARVPVKPVTYRRGGPLNPPATNQAAGLSVRNAKLTAKKGKSVIVWHVRYGAGCNGTLNSVLKMPVGSTFTIARPGKPTLTFQILKRDSVPKNRLKKAWFARTGPHRLVLLTCDDLQGGVFRRTQAVIAKRIPTPPPAAAAQPVPPVPAAPTAAASVPAA